MASKRRTEPAFEKADKTAITSIDPEVQYVLRLEAKLEADAKAFEATLDESARIEVDSYYDSDFGLLYRVWRGSQRLGNFYRSPKENKWVAEPFCCYDRNRYDTAEQAKAAVIAAWE